MIKTLTIIIYVLSFIMQPISAQLDFRVMSYNVENLFDTTIIRIKTIMISFQPEIATGHADVIITNFNR